MAKKKDSAHSSKSSQKVQKGAKQIARAEWDKYRSAIGSLVKKYRNMLGWSQEKLAAEVGCFWETLPEEERKGYHPKGENVLGDSVVTVQTVKRVEAGHASGKTIKLITKAIGAAWELAGNSPIKWHLSAEMQEQSGTSIAEHGAIQKAVKGALREMSDAIRAAATLQSLNYIFDKYHSDVFRHDMELLRTTRIKWGEENDRWALQWGEWRSPNAPVDEKKVADELDASRRRVFSLFYRIRLLVLTDFLEISKAFAIFGGFSAAIPRIYLLPMGKIITSNYDKGFFEFWKAIEDHDWITPARQVAASRKERQNFKFDLMQHLPEFFD